MNVYLIIAIIFGICSWITQRIDEKNDALHIKNTKILILGGIFLLIFVWSLLAYITSGLISAIIIGVLIGICLLLCIIGFIDSEIERNKKILNIKRQDEIRANVIPTIIENEFTEKLNKCDISLDVDTYKERLNIEISKVKYDAWNAWKNYYIIQFKGFRYGKEYRIKFQNKSSSVVSVEEIEGNLDKGWRL